MCWEKGCVVCGALRCVLRNVCGGWGVVFVVCAYLVSGIVNVVFFLCLQISLLKLKYTPYTPSLQSNCNNEANEEERRGGLFERTSTLRRNFLHIKTWP